MPFRLDCKTVFLTYPQSDFNNDELYEFLKSIAPVSWARICRETHADGNPHSHCVIGMSKRFTTRNERFFDFKGRHPKVEGCRNVSKALEYCEKAGNYADYGRIPSGSSSKSWEDIVEASQGPELDWLRCVHEQKISMHVAKRLRGLYESGNNDLAEYDGAAYSVILETLPSEWQSMLVIGKPGIGKTMWAMAKSKRPCLLVKHLDQLRYFRPGYHQSIFFDDCDFKHLPRSTQLQICDYDGQCQIHVRYGVACIPRFVPRLFCCNPGNEPFILDEAIQGRRLATYVLPAWVGASEPPRGGW